VADETETSESRRPKAPWRARLLRAAFGLLYRSRTLYWLASTLPFAGQWHVWQRRALSRVVGRDVLDVGCGPGTLLADLVAAGYRCRAVDVSPQMVDAARAELRRRGLAGHDVHVVPARVQELPFADASFDTVTSTFPTEYIYDPLAIREIARVLRPGGCLIVVEGAMLLPATLWVIPLVAFQALIYGQSLQCALERGEARRRAVPQGQVYTEDLPARASAIPLESAGLRRREQRDWSRLWVVYVTVGEKVLVGADRP
jgi:SAM-dependent methyltransferase